MSGAREQTMSKSIKTALLIIGCLAAIVAWYNFLYYPPLLRGLPRGIDPAAAELTTRLQQRFPDGYSEDELINHLLDQGFRINVFHGTGCDPIKRVMYIWLLGPLLGPVPNTSTWFVAWSHDRAGKVNSIRGGFYPNWP